MLKNESIYPFHKFEENPPIFMKLSWSFFILVIFQYKFHFLDLLFSNRSCCEWRLCGINLELTVHIMVFLKMLLRFPSHNDVSFHGSAGLSGCCDK